ncbi:GNAT family N-acetyltransferase [Salsipaludibacter albus]|uniref:GNAT family N-acetyltransferase n=1 Tax=Salsipaludibacter albus TaxID=2849650 RepID=UPI001EE45AD5|nr:GNAT family N-acetyltransferase [Salsipaludibacter albus]MBY5161270.1 GNAT family N-acetyltransferase [Salsipaludibacter albus]
MTVTEPRIDLVHDMDDLYAAADLWRTVWGGTAWPVQASLLRANVHAGNYAAGAWLGDRLVGASMGFLAHPGSPVLHSHITGVLADAAGHGVGRALKAHQARWCTDHGIDVVTWTYDPLVARNAWFNLSRLGVTVTEYLVDFYGDMPDAVNRGQGSDRLHVAWDVSTWSDEFEPAPAVPATADAEPVVVLHDDGDRPRSTGATPGPDDVVAVALPADVEDLRRRDPDLAARWRHAVRDAMADRLGGPDRPGGWRLAGFTRDRHYLLVPGDPVTASPSDPA